MKMIDQDRVVVDLEIDNPAKDKKPDLGSDPADFELALNGVVDYAIFLLDERGFVRSWNRGAERIKGYSANEIIGRHFTVFYPAEAVASGYPDQELRWAADRGHFEDEGWRIRQDGSRFWANVAITALRTPNGELRGFSKVTRDLTERKLAEEALAESEAKLRKVVNSDFIGIFFWEETGTITESNDAFLKIVGYSREDLLAGTVRWDSMTPSQFREGDLTALEEIKQKGYCTTLDKEFIRKDGKPISVLLGASAFDRDGTRGAAFVIDNSERKKNEREIYEARRELETRVSIRTRELEATTAELRQAKEAADSANRAKSEFLSRMSHELRTPLNAIAGFGQILVMQGLNEDQASSVEFILKGASHLLQLINEVLDIAKVESGKLELSLEPVAVGDVIRECISLVRPIASQHEITVQTHDGSMDHVHVLADYHRLKQVLINLISNAIKYNRRNGSVFIPFECEAGKVRIAVSDTGEGLRPESMTKLFLPFERLEAANSHIEGTGLGLALSQRVVEAMDGTLSARSNRGIGSTFYIELNAAEVPATDGSLSPAAPVGTEDESSRQFRVLAIEDNPANYALLRSILAFRPNIHLECAVQGQVGLDLAESHVPDLILLDLHLPDLPGSEVLRKLRRSPANQKTPVVVVSADATKSQSTRMLEAGADAYLSKPLDVKQFLATVDEMLRKVEEGHSVD